MVSRGIVHRTEPVSVWIVIDSSRPSHSISFSIENDMITPTDNAGTSTIACTFKAKNLRPHVDHSYLPGRRIARQPVRPFGSLLSDAARSTGLLKNMP